MFTATKELAFGTVTLTTGKSPEDTWEHPAGALMLHHVNNHTAIVTPVALVFKPSREMANPAFPIDYSAAMQILSRAVNNLWGEVVEPMAAETKEDYSFHFSDNEVWDAFIQSAKSHKFNIDDLPQNIETPIGIFAFVPEPTRDNFTSIENLPNFMLNATHENTGEVRTFWMSVKPAGALLEQFIKVARGETLRHAALGSVDMAHIRNLICARLHDSFARMGYIELENDNSFRSRHMGHMPRNPSSIFATAPVVALPEPVYAPFMFATAQLMSVLHECGEQYNPVVNEFTISTDVLPDEHGNSNAAGTRATYVNATYRGLRFMIGMSDTIPAGRHSYEGNDAYRGTVMFMGSRRTLKVMLKNNNRYGSSGDAMSITDVMPCSEADKAFRLMLEALAQPVGLLPLIDWSTVSWEPQTK